MIVEKQVTDESIARMKDNALLAILLSSERANYCSIERATGILKACQNSLNCLYSLSIEEVGGLLGLSYSEAIRIKAAMELAQRRKVAEVLEKPKISCSYDIYVLFQHLSDCQYEEFWIVVLSKANRVIDRYKVSEGGVTGTVVDIRRIFHHSLNILGTGLILVHNHPSGNINPSEADISITKKIVEAGKLFDILVLDHLIIGKGNHYSFADSSLL
jgi:DNA repair protein RadC